MNMKRMEIFFTEKCERSSIGKGFNVGKIRKNFRGNILATNSSFTFSSGE
jgi:hypothetical protein